MRRIQRNRVLVIGAVLMTMTIECFTPASFVYAQQETISSAEDQTTLESMESVSELGSASSGETEMSSAQEELSVEAQSGEGIQTERNESSKVSYQFQLDGQIKLERKEMKFPLKEWENVDLEIEEVYVRKDSILKAGDPIFKISTESMQKLLEYYNNQVGKADAALEEAEVKYEIEKNKAEYDKEHAKQGEKQAETVKQTELQALQDSLTYLGKQIETIKLKLESYTKALNKNIYYEQYGISDMAKALTDSKGLMENAQKILSKAQTELDEAQKSSSNNSDEEETTDSAIHSDAIKILEDLVKQAEKNYSLIQEQYDKSLSDYGRQVSNTQITIRDLRDSLVSLQEEYEKRKEEHEWKSMEINKAYDLAMLLSKNADTRYAVAVEAMEDEKAKLRTEVEKWTQIRDQLYNMEDGILYAPQDMTITSFTYHNGDKIEKDRSLFTYDDASAVTVTVQVPQQEIVEWNIGDSVMVEVEGYEKLFSGKVSSMDLGKSIQKKEGDIFYTATILIEQGEERLNSGWNATVLCGAISSSSDETAQEVSTELSDASSQTDLTAPESSAAVSSESDVVQESSEASLEAAESVVSESQTEESEPSQ